LGRCLYVICELGCVTEYETMTMLESNALITARLNLIIMYIFASGTCSNVRLSFSALDHTMYKKRTQCYTDPMAGGGDVDPLTSDNTSSSDPKPDPL